MPQHTTFPSLRSGDASAAVADLVRVCRQVPESGMAYKEFRSLLREHKLWDKDRFRDLLAFFKLGEGAKVERSGVIGALCAATGDGRGVLAERLWTVNPLVFKAVMDCLSERVYHRDEVYIFLESMAFRGARLSRPALEDWFRLARGLEVIRPVGVGVAVGEQGGAFLERAGQFDIDEFLEDDEPEVAPRAEGGVESGAEEGAGADPAAPLAVSDDAAPETVRPAPTTRMTLPLASVYAGLPSPLDGRRAVSPSRFSGAEFPKDVLEETAALIDGWWQGVADPVSPLSPDDFAIDGELWVEQPELVLYRLAVAAALTFRLEVTPKAAAEAFIALDEAGVLTDLYDGTVPTTLPEVIDPRALMLASLAARRCAEFGELPASIDSARSAAEAFAALDGALGHGLFRLELFWIMRQLATLGVARWPDTADFTSLPTRRVRDVLFRLGFLATPYASDADALVAAAKAVRSAVSGDAVDAARDHALEAFAAAAGCEYGCGRRRTCPAACRERLEAI